MRRRRTIAVVTLATACSLPWTVAARARSVWDGVYSDVQASRGEGVYRRTCTLCHGPTLDGTETAPELRGATLFKPYYGRSVHDLFTQVQEKMPKDAPKTLSASETADVLAYIFRVNKLPAGAAELDPSSDALAEIRIEPKPQP